MKPNTPKTLNTQKTVFAWVFRREICEIRVNPLAIQMLEGTFHDGDAIAVDFEDGAFVFQKA